MREFHPHKEISEILAESEKRVRQFLAELEASRHNSYRLDKSSKKRFNTSS